MRVIQKKSLDPLFDITAQQQSKSRKHAYRPLGSYFRFIVATDKGFITHRATSYLRTILRWLNHYEDLKNYEIDHKKSSGAYTWVLEASEKTTELTFIDSIIQFFQKIFLYL